MPWTQIGRRVHARRSIHLEDGRRASSLLGDIPYSKVGRVLLQHGFGADSVNELVEDTVTGADHERIDKMIGDSDTGRKGIVIGLHLSVARPAVAGGGGHDRAAIGRRPRRNAGGI